MTPSALILLYHRVADVPADPQLLCVSTRNFTEQMELLRHYGQPIPLRRLTAGLRDRSVERRSIVVTFDDGYADNFHSARPILEQCEIPASVFVTTASIGQLSEYWWDELERLLLQPGVLPASLNLRVNGSTLDWRLGNATVYTESDHRKHAHWNVAQATPTERHGLYVALHRMIRPLPDAQRRGVIDELRSWCGAESNGRPGHRPMTARELQSLVAGGLIEVGAHTVTHPMLSAIPVDIQQREIAESKTTLEDILNRPVDSFAYPFGGLRDYTPATVAAVRDAGFQSACSNYPGLVQHGADGFQLARMLVRDWNGDEFARHLRNWFDGA